VSPLVGELFTLIMPYTNTECMNIFLKELSKQYSAEYILLIVDNAAWHRSKGLIIPENIELYPLLPYTPELNPIEQIWDELREKGFRNEIFSTLEHVVYRLCDTIVDLVQVPSRVASITHRAWII